MIKWQLVMSFSGKWVHSLLYRGEYRGQGVQMEIHTPLGESGRSRQVKTVFFCDGDKREFDSEDELIAAIDERLTGKHEKVIAKIMLPVDTGMLKALNECFPSGIIVEPHGDEIWVMKREVAG